MTLIVNSDVPHVIHSHSSLKTFATCPRQYHEIKILKAWKQEESESMAWGTYVHKCFEEYVQDGTPLPANVSMYEPIIAKIAKSDGVKLVEHKMALSVEWQSAGFFDKEIIFRGVADLIVLRGSDAIIADYKLGSAKYPDMQQLERMALCLMIERPEINKVTGVLLFIKENIIPPKKVFTRDNLAYMINNLTKAMQQEAKAHAFNLWMPKPSGLCKGWCPVKSCEFYEKPRKFK